MEGQTDTFHRTYCTYVTYNKYSFSMNTTYNLYYPDTSIPTLFFSKQTSKKNQWRRWTLFQRLPWIHQDLSKPKRSIKKRRVGKRKNLHCRPEQDPREQKRKTRHLSTSISPVDNTKRKDTVETE